MNLQYKVKSVYPIYKRIYLPYWLGKIYFHNKYPVKMGKVFALGKQEKLKIKDQKKI